MLAALQREFAICSKFFIIDLPLFNPKKDGIRF